MSRRIHYIERTKVFTALCGAIAGSTDPDGTINSCHFVPRTIPDEAPDKVCAECLSIATEAATR